MGEREERRGAAAAEEPPARPTLKTIAESTGLGVSTVSRALKDAPEIAERTKERVRAVADSIGYRPDRAGVRLRTGRTQVISFILDPHEEIVGYGNSVILGLSRGLRDTGYHLVVTPSFLGSDPMDPVRYVLDTRAADGLVFSRTKPLDERVRYLVARDFPFVSHGRTELGLPHAYYDHDSYAFGHAAARRLLDRGRTRLALLAPNAASTFHHHMVHGFLTAVREAGARRVELDGLDLDTPADALREAIRALAAGPDRPDGVVVGGETPAFPLIAGLRDAGLRVGLEVEVVAKQTSSVFDHFEPAIDTYYEDLVETGRKLAELLLARLAGEPVEGLQQLGAPEPRLRTG